MEWGKIDERETTGAESLEGCKKSISEAFEKREAESLRKETKEKEVLEVYGRLNEGIGFKEYLDGPLDEGTRIKVKFRTGDIDLRERRRRFRKLDDEDKFKCDCGAECEDRVHVVAECPSYDQEREGYMVELEKVDSRYREKFEAWNKEEKTVAVLGCKMWPRKDRFKVDRLGKTFLSHL